MYVPLNELLEKIAAAAQNKKPKKDAPNKPDAIELALSVLASRKKSN